MYVILLNVILWYRLNGSLRQLLHNKWSPKWKAQWLGNEVCTTFKRRAVSLPHRSFQFYGLITWPYRGSSVLTALPSTPNPKVNEWLLDTTALDNKTDDDEILVSVWAALRTINKTGRGRCQYLPEVCVLKFLRFPPIYFSLGLWLMGHFTLILSFIPFQTIPLFGLRPAWAASDTLKTQNAVIDFWQKFLGFFCIFVLHLSVSTASHVQGLHN